MPAPPSGSLGPSWLESLCLLVVLNTAGTQTGVSTTGYPGVSTVQHGGGSHSRHSNGCARLTVCRQWHTAGTQTRLHHHVALSGHNKYANRHVCAAG